MVSTLSQLGGASYHLPVPAPQFPECTARAPSQMCCVSPLGSWSLAVTLLVDVNHPGSQEGLISNWGPAHSLVEDVGSGVEIAPHLLALAVAHLPLCLRRAEGPVCSCLALLWCSLNPLFCEQAMLSWESSLSRSLFFLSVYPTIWVAISCEVSQIVLRAFRPGPYPKHVTCASLFSPRCCWRAGASGLPLRWKSWLGA